MIDHIVPKKHEVLTFALILRDELKNIYFLSKNTNKLNENANCQRSHENNSILLAQVDYLSVTKNASKERKIWIAQRTLKEDWQLH